MVDIKEMETNVRTCLDRVPLLKIRRCISSYLNSFALLILFLRYANRSAHFISAYSQGLDGGEAAWANKKYHGHRTLPASLINAVHTEFK